MGDEVPDQRRSRLFEVLGHVLTCQSRFREAGESYLAAADKTQVDEERAMHFSRASFQFLWGHHYDEAEHYAGEAIALAKRCRSLAAAIQARGTLAHITMTRDGVAGLAGTSERPGVLARRAEESRDDEAIAIAGYMEGIVAEMCGDYRVAIEHCGRAVAAARRARLPQLFLNPLWIAGLAHACLGEYRQGIASLAEAVDLAARNEEKAMKARFLNSLGWCFAEIGCHELARGFNEQSIALAGELVELGLVAAAPEIHCNASINLAGDRIVAGDADGALELLDPIRAELEVPGDPWQRWRYGMHVRDALARVELLRGEPERALPLVERELAAARTQSARKLEARALELHGRTLLRLERHDDARRSLREALEVAKSIGYPPVRWRALSLLAELARRRGDAEAAERLAQESRRLVDGVASGLPTDALRAGFGSFAQRLAEDPLAALS